MKNGKNVHYSSLELKNHFSAKMKKNVQIKATEERPTRLLFCRFVISIRSVFFLDGAPYSIHKLLDVSCLQERGFLLTYDTCALFHISTKRV